MISSLHSVKLNYCSFTVSLHSVFSVFDKHVTRFKCSYSFVLRFCPFILCFMGSCHDCQCQCSLGFSVQLKHCPLLILTLFSICVYTCFPAEATMQHCRCVSNNDLLTMLPLKQYHLQNTHQLIFYRYSSHVVCGLRRYCLKVAIKRREARERMIMLLSAYTTT